MIYATQTAAAVRDRMNGNLEWSAPEGEYHAASKAMQQFPRGPMGLTPDAVKATPEWRAAKQRLDRAFARLRAFNVSLKRTRRA